MKKLLVDGFTTKSATLLTAAGVPPRLVMEILGHSQVAVTSSRTSGVSHLDRMLKRQRPDRG